MSQDALQKGIFPREALPVDVPDGPDGPDAVDAIIAQWHRERPDLDASGKEITGRIVRLAGLFNSLFDEGYVSLGLNEGDFGVLAPLRRAGEPYELTPTELAKHRMMTSGGMTAAIDRLERKGMVSRSPNPADRRGNLVRLTPTGVGVIDEAMNRHAATEQRLVAVLDADERSQLRQLLHKLLHATEGT